MYMFMSHVIEFPDNGRRRDFNELASLKSPTPWPVLAIGFPGIVSEIPGIVRGIHCNWFAKYPEKLWGI